MSILGVREARAFCTAAGEQWLTQFLQQFCRISGKFYHLFHVDTLLGFVYTLVPYLHFLYRVFTTRVGCCFDQQKTTIGDSNYSVEQQICLIAPAKEVRE